MIQVLLICMVYLVLVALLWYSTAYQIFLLFLQYPVSEHGFEFQQLLVETLYGYSVWDRLRSLVNLIKMVTEQNSAPASNATTKKRR